MGLQVTDALATQYLLNRGDVVRLSIILGHTEVSTTMKYLHLLTGDQNQIGLRLLKAGDAEWLSHSAGRKRFPKVPHLGERNL